MNLIPVVTVVDEAVPALNGLSHSLPAIPFNGLVGGLLASAIKGKEIDATLAVVEGEDSVTETVTFTSSVPFVGGFLKPLTETQVVPAEVAKGLAEIVPLAGLNALAVKITFQAA